MRATLLILLALPAFALTPVEVQRARLPRLSVPLSSGSMHPLLQAGDTVSLTAADYRSLKVGDLVARMDWPPWIVLHQIIRNDGTAGMPRWVTKGCNNWNADPGYMWEEKFVGLWSVVKRGSDNRPVVRRYGLRLQVARE